MNAETGHSESAPRHRSCLAALLVASFALGASAVAQVPVDDDGNRVGNGVSVLDRVDIENPTLGAGGELSSADLDDLIGPIALYPDDLLAVVLPASTYPLEIVQAARYLELVESQPSLEPDESWDDSVVALLNYPDILRMMNDDLEWTWQLGEAVVRQQSDVILAIESFRDRAYAAGNLNSDEYQTVSVDEGVIEIEPANDDVIYVPYYEPERVVYRSPTPVYFYYPQPYPVYYYPYPRRVFLSSGNFWGVTTAFTIGWSTNHLRVFHHSYDGHPYYGHYYDYHGSYWRRPSISIYNTWYVNHTSPYYKQRHKRGDSWRPRHRSGARPATRIVHSGYNRDRHDRSDDRGRGRDDYRQRRANDPPDRRANDLAVTRQRDARDAAERTLRRDNSREAFRRQAERHGSYAGVNPSRFARDREATRSRSDRSRNERHETVRANRVAVPAERPTQLRRNAATRERTSEPGDNLSRHYEAAREHARRIERPAPRSTDAARSSRQRVTAPRSNQPRNRTVTRPETTSRSSSISRSRQSAAPAARPSRSTARPARAVNRPASGGNRAERVRRSRPRN